MIVMTTRPIFQLPAVGNMIGVGQSIVPNMG